MGVLPTDDVGEALRRLLGGCGGQPAGSEVRRAGAPRDSVMRLAGGWPAVASRRRRVLRSQCHVGLTDGIGYAVYERTTSTLAVA